MLSVWKGIGFICSSKLVIFFIVSLCLAFNTYSYTGLHFASTLKHIYAAKVFLNKPINSND